jgi:hypothetical protein
MPKVTKIKQGAMAAAASWPAQHPDPQADKTIRLARAMRGPAAGPIHGTDADVLAWARVELAHAGDIKIVPGNVPASWWSPMGGAGSGRAAPLDMQMTDAQILERLKRGG